MIIKNMKRVMKIRKGFGRIETENEGKKEDYEAQEKEMKTMNWIMKDRKRILKDKKRL